MEFRTWSGYKKPDSGPAMRHRRATGAWQSRARLQIEPLEDRSLPSGYTFTDLGTIGGGVPFPDDINASAQIVGSAPTSAGDGHAFLWNDGTMIDLGTFGGATSNAAAINAGGQVAGWALDAVGRSHAFLVSPEDTDGDGAADRWFRDTDGDGVNDLMRDLGTLGGGQSAATDVNNLGQVVGWSNTAAGDQRAFRWQDGTMADPGALAGLQTTACAINDAGQIAGGFNDGVGGPTYGNFIGGTA